MRYLFVLFALVLMTNTFASQDGSQMLSNDKRWNYRTYTYGGENVYYCLHIVGDTLIDGTQAKVVMQETYDTSGLHSIMREEGGKVFIYNGQEKNWTPTSRTRL